MVNMNNWGPGGHQTPPSRSHKYLSKGIKGPIVVIYQRNTLSEETHRVCFQKLRGGEGQVRGDLRYLLVWSDPGAAGGFPGGLSLLFLRTQRPRRQVPPSAPEEKYETASEIRKPKNGKTKKQVYGALPPRIYSAGESVKQRRSVLCLG